MGYLLKEALKTLCDVNRWSYAVFWKIGCRNPRLLIWEECYYEPSAGSENKLHLLVNRMMEDNQICLVGKGIIGRAAFTGNYQWFVSNSYVGDAHLPEVSNAMNHQFSAGIQTVAVIPVSPHGVVQLGSSFTISENFGFVNDIRGLILQMGCIPGALFSLDSEEKVGVLGHSRSGFTDTSEVGKETSSTNMRVDSWKELSNSLDCSRVTNEQPNSLIKKVQENSSVSDSSSRSPFQPLEKLVFYPSNLERGVVRAEVIHSSPVDQFNCIIDPCNSYSGSDVYIKTAQVGAHQSIIPIKTQKPSVFRTQNLVRGTGSFGHGITSQLGTECCSLLDACRPLDAPLCLEGGAVLNGFENHSKPVVPVPSFPAAAEPSLSNLVEVEYEVSDTTELEGMPLFNLSEQLASYATEVLPGGFDHLFHPQIDSICRSTRMGNYSAQVPMSMTDLNEAKSLVDNGCAGIPSSNIKYEDAFRKPEGDDLYDILGTDMKRKILSEGFDRVDSHELSMDMWISANTNEVGQHLNLSDASILEVGISSVSGNDHLLDAVVSGVYPTEKLDSDDSVSCKTALTKISGSSVPSSSGACHHSNSTGKMQEDLFKDLRLPGTVDALGSGSHMSVDTKDNGKSCSHSNPICSQITSWIDQSHAMKHNDSILTANSKGPNEETKPSRKRLKSGGNPKPRPKDRQLIQDRLKELRDIVPNGAKCSIDLLLERTFKHMMFLQGVTKHVNNIKHVCDSRIIDNEGGLFLKDNFKGGATWAYEIGSPSGTCPVIVEDLNPPRQFLVEMLCEDRGSFLEIADMIRQHGLTILSGVMESCSGKIWARFAVEANRDITRMEVFMSLVLALEQDQKDGLLPPETTVNNHLMPPHQPFPEATSIPCSVVCSKPC